MSRTVFCDSLPLKDHDHARYRGNSRFGGAILSDLAVRAALGATSSKNRPFSRTFYSPAIFSTKSKVVQREILDNIGFMEIILGTKSPQEKKSKPIAGLNPHLAL